MYEQFGIPGMQAFKRTCDYAKSKGLVIIGDIKRGDSVPLPRLMPSVMWEKYRWEVIRILRLQRISSQSIRTLGSDGVKPFIKVVRREKGHVYSCEDIQSVQRRVQDRLIDGRPLMRSWQRKWQQWGEEHMGEDYSYVGAVVGATYPEMGAVLRKLMPKNYILVPGYGAQGYRKGSGSVL